MEAFHTNLTYELSELVKIALAIRGYSKFSDATVEFICSFKGILEKHFRIICKNNYPSIIIFFLMIIPRAVYSYLTSTASFFMYYTPA